MRRFGSWLGHPATLIALVALVVNDHVLKGAFPGVVTGKLSDAAGLVLAPPLVALIVRRPAAALWSVGVVFSLVKSSAYGASAASALWGLVHGPSLVRADPTDLVTLPFLGVAWWAYRSASRRPEVSSWVRALRMAVLLPLALGGVAASAEAPADYANRVVSTKDAIYLISKNATEQWVVSDDEGATWKESPATVPAPKAGAPARQACAAAICYRVLDDTIGVQRSADGGATWATDWRIGDNDRRLLSHRYPHVDDIDTDLVSVSIAVHGTADGGHIVVVADRRDGFAMRDTDGTWRRLGFPEVGEENPPALGETRIEETGFRYGALGVLVAAVLSVVVAGGAGPVRRRWWIGVPLLALVPSGLLLMAYAGLDPDTFIFYPFLLVSPFVSVVGCVALAIGATVTVVRDGPGRRLWALSVWACALAAGAAVALVMLQNLPGWTKGATAAFAAVFFLVPAVLAGRRVAASTRPVQDRSTPRVPA